MTPKPQAIWRRAPYPKQFILGFPTLSNPVGLRSGFAGVVLVWRWCSLVFEKHDCTTQGFLALDMSYSYRQKGPCKGYIVELNVGKTSKKTKVSLYNEGKVSKQNPVKRRCPLIKKENYIFHFGAIEFWRWPIWILFQHSVAGQLVQTSRWCVVAFVHLLCPVWQCFLEALGKRWKPLGIFPHICNISGSWGLPPFQHPQHLDMDLLVDHFDPPCGVLQNMRWLGVSQKTEIVRLKPGLPFFPGSILHHDV